VGTAGQSAPVNTRHPTAAKRRFEHRLAEVGKALSVQYLAAWETDTPPVTVRETRHVAVRSAWLLPFAQCLGRLSGEMAAGLLVLPPALDGRSYALPAQQANWLAPEMQEK